MKNDKTKHKYFVGWKGDWQCVYGKDTQANPLTLTQAIQQIETFLGRGTKMIYKLVPVCRITPPRPSKGAEK